MAEHFFYNIMRKVIVQTLDVFNGIKIAKYSSSGEIESYVNVPLVFAPKTKQWYFQQSQRNVDGLTITDNVYPTMAIQMTGFDYAKDRTVNNLQKIIVSTDSVLSQHLTPIPYDYQFSLEVVAEYFIDIIQIIEQILPWFNPFITVRVTIPELNIKVHTDTGPNEAGSGSLEIRVVYNGTNVDSPVEIDLANIRLLKWDLQFSVKGYLFQPVKSEPIIKKIINDIYTNKDAFDLSTMGTSAVSGCFMDVISNSDIKKYDDDIRILYKFERIENV